MKVINEQDNILLNRKEVNLLIEHNGIAPKKNVILDEIGKHFKTDNSLVAIKGIYPKYGSYELNVIAYIYESLDIMKKIESINKKIKKDGEKKGKKQATK